MNNHNDNEQPSAETAPNRKRRKYRSKKLGASGLSARMAKTGSFKTSWSGLFHTIKGRV